MLMRELNRITVAHEGRIEEKKLFQGGVIYKI